MILPDSSKSEEVEQILRNAQLRDELEPLFDESIDRVNPAVMTTRCENEFLESMLEWERAPILPIYEARGIVHRVDGMADIAQVTAEIEAILDRLG